MRCINPYNWKHRNLLNNLEVAGLKRAKAGAGAARAAPAASRAPGSDRTNLMSGGPRPAARVDSVRSNMLAKLGLSGGRRGGGGSGGRGKGRGAAAGPRGPQPSAFGAAFGSLAAAGADPASESR